jgi:hypothetical protein
MPIAKRKAQLHALRRGVNYTDNILSIQTDEAYYILNCHIDMNGNCFTRKGSRNLNLTALNGAVTSIYDFHKPVAGGTEIHTMVTAGGILYEWNTSTLVFDAIGNLASTARPTWCTFQDENDASFAFLANGTDFKKYDGTGSAGLSNVAVSYPWTNNPKYIIAYGDRMLAAGCELDEYKVFICEALDGTNWKPGAGSTAEYWTAAGQKGDPVTGLGVVYNFGLIFQNYGIGLLTEADVASTTAAQIQISQQYGTSSCWSVQTVGNDIYFADANHIYKGVLRDAVTNGLIVKPIDDRIGKKYADVTNITDITSVYDPNNEEILWGTKTRAINLTNNTAFVYNLRLSGETANGTVYTWNGWFEGAGYEPYTFGSIQTSVGKVQIWRGDSSGFVQVMDESTQYKDETVTGGAVVENNVITNIMTGPVMPYGMTVRKRARLFTPYLYQSVDGATMVRWIVDSRYLGPSLIRLYNTVPYFRAATTTQQKQLWGNTLYTGSAYMPRPVSINDPFMYIQLEILNNGTNATDEIAYGGGELWYQVHQLSRAVG